MYIHIYIYMYLYLYVYVYMYMHMYMHMHVLVEIGERVGVLGEAVVVDAVLIAIAAPAELVQVDDEERRDVVRPP